jgi:hypothetical protein
MAMTNQFLVRTREIILIDERDFLANGGEQLSFGPIVDDTVPLYATGSPGSIRRLAQTIIAHHTAALRVPASAERP